MWRNACIDAGFPSKLIHDFRRTAVRNLERAAVPRSTAMAMVGHKTESIYRRYAIVDETMHREAAAKLDAWADEQKAKTEALEGAGEAFQPQERTVSGSFTSRPKERLKSGGDLGPYGQGTV